jgi:hypothetical protein
MDPLRGHVWEPPSLHKYLYATGDPANKLDPTGLWSLSTGLAVAAIIGSLSGALIGGIRDGVQGAIEGAIAGAIGGPIVVLATVGVGHLLAGALGVSAATGQTIAAAGLGIFGGVGAARDLADATRPRDRLSAAITLALMLAPFLLPVQGQAASNRLVVRLRYKPGWSPEQIAAADAKVAALNEAARAGEAARALPVRGGTSAAARYRAACGPVPANCDVDHVLDLQLGGEDVLGNMNPLDSSVNRSLGAQIWNAIRDLPTGTKIDRVTIGP